MDDSDSNNTNNNDNATTTATTTLEQQQQQQQQQPPVKISFTLNSNSTNAVKRKVKEEDENKDFIKDVIGGAITSVHQERTSNQPLVIPLENQAHNKPAKVRKTLPSIEELMQNNGEVKLERVEGDEHSVKGNIKEEMVMVAISADEIKRELLHLKKGDGDGDGDGGDEGEEKRTEEKKSQILPILLQNRIEGMEDFKDDVEKFKYDLSIRPNAPDIESYDSVPIEDFGQAMLRGMGWTPNNKKDEPLEYVKRPGFRLGLGATPKAPEIQNKKYIKPGESREPAPILVAPKGSDGRVRNVKSIHEELVPLRIGVQKGGMVIILEGPHDGLYGRVVSVNGSDLVVRLQASSEEVEVSLGDVKPIDDNHPMAKSLKKDDSHHKHHHHHEHNDHHHHKKDDSHHKHHHHSEKKSSDRKNDVVEEKNNWLCPNILVKMVSKSFKDGQYYNKRAKVVDVLGAGLCIVQLDDGRLVDGVHQRMVETSIPRSKEKVLVVQGKDKGRVGILLERVKDDKKEEVGVVQLSGDLSVKNYPLDNIAHYLGDEEDDMM